VIELLEKLMEKDFTDVFKPIDDAEYERRFKGLFLFVTWYEFSEEKEPEYEFGVDMNPEEEESELEMEEEDNSIIVSVDAPTDEYAYARSLPDLIEVQSIDDFLQGIEMVIMDRDVTFVLVDFHKKSRITDEEKKKLIAGLKSSTVQVVAKDVK
jgi:hypothetical protein